MTVPYSAFFAVCVHGRGWSIESKESEEKDRIAVTHAWYKSVHINATRDASHAEETRDANRAK